MVTNLLDCGHSGDFGRTPEGTTLCYKCCAEREKRQMQETGKSCLYVSLEKEHRYIVTDWPGILKFQVIAHSVGKHNIAGSRLDVWFRGPDSYIWHGIQYGEFSELCYCTRTKRTEV